MNKIDRTNLTHQIKFRLNEKSKVENYFNQEINQRKSCSKKLSKYVTIFDYIDKILIVLSATARGFCIVSHGTIIGAPVGIASAGFTIAFCLTKEIIKKLLSTTRSKTKNHNKILMLAKSKLKSIETLVSQVLIDMDISHKEFITILKKKDKYEKMKENVRNLSEKLEEKAENMKLNSVNSRTLKKNKTKWWIICITSSFIRLKDLST